MIFDMAKRGRWLHAVNVLVTCDTLAREADGENIITDDISLHDPSGSHAPAVAIVLGAGDRSLSAKTGADQGVVVDDPFVATTIAAFVARTAQRVKLFPIGQTEFRREWWIAFDNVGIKSRCSPHSL